jgi:hypothetical protein
MQRDRGAMPSRRTLWRRTCTRAVLIALVTVQFPLLDGTPQAPRSSGLSAVATLWTAEGWAKARRFSPLRAPPADPTNALAYNQRAARLGHQLFFDPRLSPKGIACATCHQPELGFPDGLTVANTLTPLHRNTMTILNVGYYRWLTWDGARDSLWHQALGPIENAQEMGSSRLHVVRAVMQHYGAAFSQFTPWPDGWEALWPTLPPSGQPGEPAFDTLSSAHQEAVNRVFTTILKCIVSITSSPPKTMLGTLDPALVAVEITPQEKQELVDFLLSLSSMYASAWTQKPGALQRIPDP